MLTRLKTIIIFLGLFGAYTGSSQSDSTRILTVYLTFDDGPSMASRHLQEIAMIDSIPVTIFLVGKKVDTSAEGRRLFNRYKKDSLFEIANHSYSHACGKYKHYYKDPAGVVADMIKNEQYLELGKKIARLPGRNLWRVNGRKRQDLGDAAPAGDSLCILGYRLIGWDLEWILDSTGKNNYTASQVIDQVNGMRSHSHCFTKDHIVILCHDVMLLNEETRKQFRIFCDRIRNEPHLRLAHISSYPGIANKTAADLVQQQR